MDQDDSMLSTPSSHDDEDELFPTQAAIHNTYVAAQPPQNDHLNAAAPGELSPPRSQSTSAPSGQTNGFGSMIPRRQIDGDAASLTDDDEAIDVKGDGRAGQRDVKFAEKQKPGAGWKNKKVQEQMNMSWDHIVDRDFDVRQFGDVLAQEGQGN